MVFSFETDCKDVKRRSGGASAGYSSLGVGRDWPSPPSSATLESRVAESSRTTRTTSSGCSTSGLPRTVCGPNGQNYTADGKCLLHQISSVDTLPSLAFKYGISVFDIRRANRLTSGGDIWFLQHLLIPLSKPIDLELLAAEEREGSEPLISVDPESRRHDSAFADGDRLTDSKKAPETLDGNSPPHSPPNGEIPSSRAESDSQSTSLLADMLRTTLETDRVSALEKMTDCPEDVCRLIVRRCGDNWKETLRLAKWVMLMVDQHADLLSCKEAMAYLLLADFDSQKAEMNLAKDISWEKGHEDLFPLMTSTHAASPGSLRDLSELGLAGSQCLQGAVTRLVGLGNRVRSMSRISSGRVSSRSVKRSMFDDALFERSMDYGDAEMTNMNALGSGELKEWKSSSGGRAGRMMSCDAVGEESTLCGIRRRQKIIRRKSSLGFNEMARMNFQERLRLLPVTDSSSECEGPPPPTNQDFHTMHLGHSLQRYTSTTPSVKGDKDTVSSTTKSPEGSPTRQKLVELKKDQ